MKISKKVIIPVSVVAVIGIVSAIVYFTAKPPSIVSVTTTPLEVTDLVNTVDVTGTVESLKSQDVYSTLAYQVKSVSVEVGDVVKEGDVLAVLDTEALQLSIAQSRASISAAQSKAALSVAIAEKNLETAEFNRDKDYDSQLLTAQAQVKSAEIAVKQANLKVTDARRAYRDWRDGKSSEEINANKDPEITLRDALTTAELSEQSAMASLESAQANLRAANMQNKEQIITSQDSITSAELNTNFSDQYIAIEKLEKDVKAGTITAPVSGTITAVNAKEGASGSGLLFVIEDTDNLKVKTNIKEYDVSTVKIGNKVTIKSDGSGEEEYNGNVNTIAPSVSKTATTKDAEFPTEVVVDSKDTLLRIGMSARLKIIVEEKTGVKSVPYELLTSNQAGDSVVYVARKQGDDTYIVAVVPVETGMETDFASEIISDQLNAGDLIISNFADVKEGDVVLLEESIIAGAGGKSGLTPPAGTPGGEGGGPAVRMGG